MWTKENITNQSKKYVDNFMHSVSKKSELTPGDLRNAYIAGCNYILNNTQKEEY